MFDVRFLIGSRHIPQIGPFHAKLGGQTASQRKTQADNAVRIAFDGVDERSTEASSVKEPATSNGSPVAMYRSISVSEYSQKCSVALLAPRAIRPVAKSIRQWPVHNSPVAPRMARSRSRATSALCACRNIRRQAGTWNRSQESADRLRTGQARLAINEISNRFGDRRNGDSRKIAGLTSEADCTSSARNVTR